MPELKMAAPNPCVKLLTNEQVERQSVPPLETAAPFAYNAATRFDKVRPLIWLVEFALTAMA